jgi:hypothetical protein
VFGWFQSQSDDGMDIGTYRYAVMQYKCNKEHKKYLNISYYLTYLYRMISDVLNDIQSPAI